MAQAVRNRKSRQDGATALAGTPLIEHRGRDTVANLRKSVGDVAVGRIESERPACLVVGVLENCKIDGVV